MSLYLSEHAPSVCVPVQWQILVENPQSVLFEDGRDVHCALDRRHGFVEDAIDEDNPLL